MRKTHLDSPVSSSHLRNVATLPVFYALLLVPVYLGAFGWLPEAFPEEVSESEVETLNVIEVTGQTITSTPLTFSFPGPTVYHQSFQTNLRKAPPLPDLHINRIHAHTSQPLIDQTGAIRGVLSPAKPIKTEHPPYPRRARESGWRGKVTLQLTITPDGKVRTATIHESSGYPLLDDSAIQSANHWTFEPAKNGGFPVASTVNIPIQFDLVP